MLAFCLLNVTLSDGPQVGMAVLKLQQTLPGARVVYCSATGASEPRNLAYMTRLGLWGPGVPSFHDFQVKVPINNLNQYWKNIFNSCLGSLCGPLGPGVLSLHDFQVA